MNGEGPYSDSWKYHGFDTQVFGRKLKIFYSEMPYLNCKGSKLFITII